MRSGFRGVRAARLAFYEPVCDHLLVPPRVPFEPVRGRSFLGLPGAFRALSSDLRERVGRRAAPGVPALRERALARCRGVGCGWSLSSFVPLPLSRFFLAR